MSIYKIYSIYENNKSVEITEMSCETDIEKVVLTLRGLEPQKKSSKTKLSFRIEVSK